MNKNLMIDIFMYLGYTVAILTLISICIVILYYIVMRLLDFKKVRDIFFKYSLRKSLEDYSDDEYETLLLQMHEFRYLKEN